MSIYRFSQVYSFKGFTKNKKNLEFTLGSFRISRLALTDGLYCDYRCPFYSYSCLPDRYCTIFRECLVKSDSGRSYRCASCIDFELIDKLKPLIHSSVFSLLDIQLESSWRRLCIDAPLEDGWIAFSD